MPMLLTATSPGPSLLLGAEQAGAHKVVIEWMKRKGGERSIKQVKQGLGVEKSPQQQTQVCLPLYNMPWVLKSSELTYHLEANISNVKYTPKRRKIWPHYGYSHDAHSSPPFPLFLLHQTLTYLVQRLNWDLEINEGKEIEYKAHEINSTTCWSLINWLFFPKWGLFFFLSLFACRWHPHISFSVGRDARSDNNWSSCCTFSSSCVIITK